MTPMCCHLSQDAAVAVKAQVKQLIQEAADLAREQAALAEAKALVRHRCRHTLTPRQRSSCHARYVVAQARRQLQEVRCEAATARQARDARRTHLEVSSVQAKTARATMSQWLRRSSLVGRAQQTRTALAQARRDLDRLRRDISAARQGAGDAAREASALTRRREQAHMDLAAVRAMTRIGVAAW